MIPMYAPRPLNAPSVYFSVGTICRHVKPFLSVASFSFFIGAWGFLDFFIPSASKHRIHPSDDLSSWFGGTRIRDQSLWYIAPLVVRRGGGSVLMLCMAVVVRS